jgi:hypothetical protein
MAIAIAIISSLIFLSLSFFHFYWGFGGRWGTDAVFPTKGHNIPPKNPGAIPSFIVALVLLSFALFVLVRSGLIHFMLPVWLQKYGLWSIAAIFILRAVGEFKYLGFFKKYTQTKFGRNDTKYYSPLCLVIGVLMLILQASLY